MNEPIDFKGRKIEAEGVAFAQDKLFPVLEAAWHEGVDENAVLYGLMDYVSRVIQAKHNGDVTSSAEELEAMAAAYAQSFKAWQGQ